MQSASSAFHWSLKRKIPQIHEKINEESCSSKTFKKWFAMINVIIIDLKILFVWFLLLKMKIKTISLKKRFNERKHFSKQNDKAETSQ